MKTNPISCKHPINVATMNVRTIREESTRLELANNCKTQQVKILGISDHKIVHEGSHQVGLKFFTIKRELIMMKQKVSPLQK